MCDRRSAFAVAALLALSAPPLAGGGDAAELLRAGDALLWTIDEGVISARVAENAVDLYVQGPDKSLCVVRDGTQAGRRVLHVGDRLWLLTPGSTHAIPIGPHQRLGGEAALADLLRLDLSRRYEATLRAGQELQDGVGCRVLDLAARDAKAPYASGTLWVGDVDHRPRRLRLALRSGKESVDVVFATYEREGDRTRLTSMEVRDLLGGAGKPATRIAVVGCVRKRLDPAIFEPAGARALP